VSKGRQRGGNHVLTSAFEHHAVLEPVQALKREGYEISLVRPTREGFIAPDAFAQALRPDTVLASVMLAQNELGCIQAIAELARIAHANGTLLHSDAVQALGRCAFDVDSLGVDAASFSAHKLGGPKGIGAFYLRGRTPFSGTQLGGGQENNRRGGTQNVAGAVGFARALELASLEQEKEAARLRKLRDYLAASLLALDRRIALTVPLTDSPNSHLPGMLNFTVAGFESQTLILKLDRAGFALSGGSACSSGSLEPSHVLSALGLSRDRALGALRVSLGRENTGEQLDAFLAALAEALGH
jgi:cysteine desulfurase